MTLHEAIIKVLKDTGKPLPASEIAFIINKNRLYIRGDKNPVPSSQIHARVKNYPHLFKKEGGFISLFSSVKKIAPVVENKISDNLIIEGDYRKDIEILIEAWNEIANAHSGSNKKYRQRSDLDALHQNLLFENIPDSLKLFRRLPLENLLEELITIFISFELGKGHELQIASLVFAFRIISLIKDDHFPNSFIEQSVEKSCNNISYLNPQEFTKLIILLNKSKYFSGIFDSFLNTIENQFSLNHKILLELLGFYDFSYERYNEEAFGYHFYSFLKHFFIEKDKKIHQYSSSNTISKLIAGLMKDRFHENNSIYDPAVGLGGFFIEIKNSIYDKEIQTIKFIGDEINNDIASLCRMNLIMNGIYNSDIRTCNSLLSPSVKAASIDISVCEPPYTGIRTFESYDLKVSEYSNIKSNDSFSQFLQLINSRLKSDGSAYIVVPESFFNTSRTLKIRKALISSDLIDYIIDMPMGFGLKSNIKISIIALNKNKPPFALDRLTFYSARDSRIFQFRDSGNDFYGTQYNNLADAIKDSQKERNDNLKELHVKDLRIKRVVIDKERIERNNYELNSNLYLSAVSEIFDGIVEKKEIVYKLKDLIIEKKFRPVSGKDLNETGTYPFIRIKNLSDNFKNFHLKITDSTLFNDIKDPIGKLIAAPCVLLAKHGEKLKPTWFDNVQGPIIISESIIPLAINTDLILPEYLFYQLYSEIVSNQFSLIKRGITMPFYRRTDLLEIKIPVPPISEQINRVAEYEKQDQQKFRLTSFINNIRLIEDPHGIKNEIETFTAKYFPKSDQVLFRTELEFEKFPFTLDDIASGKHIAASYDKLIKHMLIISSENEIHGIVTVSEEDDIDFEAYSEINAYANFLIKTTQFIRHSNASNLLAKFSHTSKNFFVGINFDLLSLSDTKNIKLKNSLENEYIDDQEFIEWTVKNSGGKKDDFLAINKLKTIQEKISRIASFFQKTSSVYKDMMNCKPEEFELITLITEADIEKIATLEFPASKILVYAKKNSVLQALADIIQNARKYSPDKKCTIKIAEFDNFVEVKLINKVSDDQIISSSKYSQLGIEWLTSEHGDGAHAGLYWAFQSIQESLGEISISGYESYLGNKLFQINVKLRKKL